MRHRRFAVTALAITTAIVLAACGGKSSDTAGSKSDESKPSNTSAPTESAGPTASSSPAQSSPAEKATGKVVIYSGRNEKLVAPLLKEAEKATGLTFEIRYAGTAEFGGQLLEEGSGSPADLFFSQDAGALGALAKAGLLAKLPDTVLDKVSPAYRATDKTWVATSGRIRVLSVNPEISPDAMSYKGIDDILNESNKGKIGFAPTNASFQSFVTALRVARGEEAAKEWLTKFKALSPKSYEKNTAVLEATEKGEVGIGLINHYYWYQAGKKNADMKAKLVYLDKKDPGSLLNVAGVGILASAKNSAGAQAVIDYMLSPEGQKYLTDKTAEYPVVEGVKSTFDLQPIDVTKPHGVDLNDLDSLKETQALLQKVGLV